MLNYSGLKACFEHSNFFKVNAWATRDIQSRTPLAGPQSVWPVGAASLTRVETDPATPKSNYEHFNHNNFNIRYWSWNYRGCWHQTCPPIDPSAYVYDALIPIAKTQ